MKAHSIAAKNCMHVSAHAHLFSSVSCFGTHLTQLLWWCGWWNMQEMFN